VDVGVAEIIKHELDRRLRQLCREHPTEYDEQFVDVKFYSVDRENLKITILIIWWYKMARESPPLPTPPFAVRVKVWKVAARWSYRALLLCGEVSRKPKIRVHYF
jgi:hypothetical protein